MAELQQHDSDQSLKGSGKKTANAGKKAVNAAQKFSKAQKAKAGGSIGKAILSAAGPEAAAIVGVVLIFLLFIFIIISAIPTGDLLGSEKEIEDEKSEVAEILRDPYLDAVADTKPHIISYLNSKYNSNATGMSVTFSKNEESFRVKTRNTDITVKFTPKYSDIEDEIFAYIHAVNGAIAASGAEICKEKKDYEEGTHEPIPKFEGSAIKKSNKKETITTEDGSKITFDAVELSDYAKKYRDDNTNELSNVTHTSKYLKELISSGGNFFKVSTTADGWDVSGVKKHTFDYGEKEVKGEQGKTYTIKDVVEGHKGTIICYVNYDISDYRKDDIKDAVDDTNKECKKANITWKDLTTNGEAVFMDEGMSLGEVLFWLLEAQYQGTYNGAAISDSGGGVGEIVIDGKGILSWPTPSTHLITSNFGWRIHPVYGYGKGHTGIDIGISYGKVYAAKEGTVVVAQGGYGGYGNAVIIDHGNGLRTLYGHLSSFKVRKGQHVAKGQQIAISGNTGVSTGPHLHFEVQVNGKPVNPKKYL